MCVCVCVCEMGINCVCLDRCYRFVLECVIFDRGTWKYNNGNWIKKRGPLGEKRQLNQG